MDLKALKTFRTIVACGSFNRAAEEMNYAQSTITMQIQKLESDVGTQLIERGKQLRLTEAGRLLHEQSAVIVKNLEQLQNNLSSLLDGEAGHVRFGAVEPLASHRIPALLGEFLALYPKIRITVEVASTVALCEQVKRGDLDMALCSSPELGTDLYFEPLFMEKFAFLLPERHPLAEQTAIGPESIRGCRLLITSKSCPYRKKLEMVLQEFGGIPLDTMEISSMSALKYYVQSGLGIALVPEMVLCPPPEGTIVRTLTAYSFNMPFGILCKTSDYPFRQASAKMYHYFKEHIMMPER